MGSMHLIMTCGHLMGIRRSSLRGYVVLPSNDEDYLLRESLMSVLTGPMQVVHRRQSYAREHPTAMTPSSVCTRLSADPRSKIEGAVGHTLSTDVSPATPSIDQSAPEHVAVARIVT